MSMGLREKQERAALLAVLQAGPWHDIALQETHHAASAAQAEAAHWCREGPGLTAPWDGPSFWAAGMSAIRGVALLFKLLSEVSAYAADPCGKFVATQGSLNGGHDAMASVYAPVERQGRAPFFQQSFLPVMPAGPLFFSFPGLRERCPLYASTC